MRHNTILLLITTTITCTYMHACILNPNTLQLALDICFIHVYILQLGFIHVHIFFYSKLNLVPKAT